MTIKVIDADSHLTETPDLWTSRLPQRWRDEGPQVVVDEEGIPYWQIGDRILHPPPYFAQGTVHQPMTWEDIDPACYDGKARLGWMDRHDIFAQVLYPNLLAFEDHALMALEPELQRLVFQAYNDHQIEVASADPERFVLIAAVPFWDIDASIEEMTRCRELGHRGVLWADTMEAHGLPKFADPRWDRFYAAAQDLEMPVNFHVGIGMTEAAWTGPVQGKRRPGGVRADAALYVKTSALVNMSNSVTIAELLTSGLCERFPRLTFVSVESGFGYVPYLLDTLDWQWGTSGAFRQYPERVLPSDYFRRQVMTMYWFERTTLDLAYRFPDNIMFETDFPHPTSLAPTPYSEGIPNPETIVAAQIESLGEELMAGILHGNAARIYHLDRSRASPAAGRDRSDTPASVVALGDPLSQSGR